MAINTSIITFKGKVGSLVGSKDSKGQNTLSAYQPNPSNPQTTKQLQQRVRFLTATSLGSGLDGQLAGMAQFAKSLRLSRRNAFTKSVLAATYEGTGGETLRVVEANPVFGSMVATVAYDHLPLSRGPLPLWRGGSPSVADSNITVSFGMLTVGDLVHLVAYNPELNQSVGSVVEATSATESATLACPQNWSGSTVHVYAYSQRFSDARARIIYLSYFNGHEVAAQADIDTLESSASYTATAYLGSVAVG